MVITPKHMTPTQFRRYILECALRDRMTYLDSISTVVGDKECDAIRKETVAEIEAIWGRLARIKETNER